MNAPAPFASRWALAKRSLTRPYPVSAPMVVLVSLVPLYVFLIGLPVLVVTQRDHIRRTVNAYLFVWITAYVCFVAYPTVAPRRDEVLGSGFAVWGLRALYAAEPPINRLPSLHVAHSFESALTCYRVHRGVRIAATLAAMLVALRTLFAKQH